jgi:hypothetical protein
MRIIDKIRLIKSESRKGKRGFLREERKTNNTQKENLTKRRNSTQPVQAKFTSTVPLLT